MIKAYFQVHTFLSISKLKIETIWEEKCLKNIQENLNELFKALKLTEVFIKSN